MKNDIMALLMNLLMAVITVCLPILAKFVAELIKKGAENAAADTQSIKLQTYIKDIADAVATAVVATNQTFVDELKKAGTFTKEAQQEALNKAMKTAIASLMPDTANFIKDVYGDIENYLNPLIEAQVKKEKEKLEAITLGVPAETGTVQSV